MSRSIVEALLSLMPSHGSALSPQLVELSGSLLAQSRHRASTLKAEEEIARTYACCHIACDRLKITLNLPPIVSRPPIPPRIYDRLYAHLDNILPKAASSSRTPNRNKSTQVTPNSSRALPSRATPSKERSLAQFRSGGDATPSRSTGRGAAPVPASALHPWIRPTLQFMCRESGQTILGPSMIAGAETIIVPGRRRTKDAWVITNLATLCATLYFFVIQQVRKLESDEEIKRETYLPLRKQILALLARARDEVMPSQGQSEDQFWEGYRAVKPKDFDTGLQEITDRQWLEDDWFVGIGDVLRRQRDTEDEHGNDGDAERAAGTTGRDETASRPFARGADSMFQDKFDFLADEKRKDYRIWKNDMLRRIGQLERETSSRMEIDT